MQFKVGDRVRIARDPLPIEPRPDNFSGHKIGYEFVIAEIYENVWCREWFGVSSGVHQYLLELISTNKSFMQDIKEKFLLALKSEPEKSYRKAGITNGDDLLTEDGTKIFLTWLLSKNPEFKTEVVDGLLAEEK
jgi:hypothetical protein